MQGDGSHRCVFTWRASVKQHAATVCGGGRQVAPVWVPGNSRHAAAVTLPDQPGGPAVVPLRQSVSHQQQTLPPCCLTSDGSAGMRCASLECHSGRSLLLVGKVCERLDMWTCQKGRIEKAALNALYTTGHAPASLMSCVSAVGAPCPCGKCRCAFRCCRWQKHRHWGSTAGTKQLDVAW